MKDNNQFTPRHYSFDFSKAATFWICNDLYLACLFNAASIALPYVENFVNYAVHYNLNQASDGFLHQKYANFIRQESLHAREHIKYNRILRENGLSCDTVVNALKHKLQWMKHSWSGLSILAVATGFENLTMSISKVVLEEGLLADAEENMKHFWAWHMMEELEHKNALMDLYQFMGGGYFRRIALLTLVLTYYCYFGARIYWKLIRIHHASRLKALRYLLGRKSFFIKSLLYSFRCYRYSYHPARESMQHLLNFDSLRFSHKQQD